MDMRILSVLLIIGVAGSFGVVDSQPRTRRSVPVVAGRSPDELASRLLRVERDVAPKGDSTTGSGSTSPAPSTSTTARQKPTTRTSFTPKSTEQTPAPTSTSSFPSSTTPRRSADTPSTTTKKPEPADSKSSTPDSSSNDASALSPRSNFNDDDTPSADHRPSQGPQVTTSTFNSNLPPMNSLPNYNGWGSSGANAFAGASAGGYAGAGSFYPPSNSFLQGRSGVYEPQVVMDYGTPYTAGNGYYNPSPFPQNNFADPTYFQRMMEQQFQQLQAQIEAQHRANMRSTHSLLAPRIWEASNSIAGGFPSPGFPDTGFGSGPNTAPAGPQSAQSAISLGPRGGFQAGAINPVGPGIESRFAEDVPAPSGNSFGVFSSSSSSTRVGPDGKQVSHKTSTTGVNDNGKVTFRTVQD